MESLSKHPPNGSVVVRRIADLDHSVRSWIRALFGREPADDEQVSVVLSTVGETAADARARARHRVLEAMDKIGEQFKHASDEELDAALDEAMRVTRPTYEPRQ